MKKLFLSFAILLLSVCGAYAAPQKIISLNPVGTEILFALGQGGKVVGVTKYCDYPEEAKKKPRVGDYSSGMNLESMLEQGIDLVVLSDLQDSLMPRLKKLGIKYVVIKQANISEVFSSIQAVGKACGQEKKADSIVKNIKGQLENIRKKVEKCKKPTAVICVSRELSEPKVRSFYAAGNETFYSNLLEIAGGKNLVKSRSTNYQKISHEGLLSLNPEVIIDVVGDKSVYHSTLKKLDTDKLFDRKNLKRQWSDVNIKAVKNGNIFIFDGTLFLRPGPRMAQIALAFAKALHPEVFR